MTNRKEIPKPLLLLIIPMKSDRNIRGQSPARKRPAKINKSTTVFIAIPPKNPESAGIVACLVPNWRGESRVLRNSE
jgi:hypothetical protein